MPITVPSALDQPTMRLEEVAEVLGISRSSAYQAAQTGELPVIRIGRRVVVPTAKIRAILSLDAASPDEAA